MAYQTAEGHCTTVRSRIRDFFRECGGVHGYRESQRRVENRADRRFYGNPLVIDYPSDYRKLSDTELIVAAPFDNEAFGELIRRYDRYIRGVVSRYASDFDDFHNGFVLHLYTKISKGEIPVNDFSQRYLGGMIRNFVVDRLRAEASRPHTIFSALCKNQNGDEHGREGTEETWMTGTEKEPWEIAQIKEEVEDLHRAFSILDEGDRLILKMRAEGMKHSQISEILGISHCAIRQRYSRAVRRIRRYMGG